MPYNSPSLHLNAKNITYTDVHLPGQPISSLNALHAIIDNGVGTDFRICTECQ